MATIRAKVIDKKHLELLTPLSEKKGANIMIEIHPLMESREQLLARLEKGYLSMSQAGRKEETGLAEEGLQGQPEPSLEFGDEEGKWW